MKPRVSIIVLLLGIAGSRVPLLADSFTFTTIEVPGSTSTTASGINNSGQIVGTFQDSSGSHGFLDANGTFTPLNFPGGTYTNANGLNDVGEIVGTYSGGGFLYNNGVFTPLSLNSPPVPEIFGQIFGINNLGQIVGYYRDPFSAAIHGFIYYNGLLTNVGVARSTRPLGINNAGQVVGGGDASGFFYDNGVFTTTDVAGATTTQFNGINDSGEIVGQFCVGPPSNPTCDLDLPGGVTQSFLYVDGTFEPIDVPGATNVFAMGINNAGDLVGSYDDASGNVRGFLATPVIPEPASLLLATSGLAAIVLLTLRSRPPAKNGRQALSYMQHLP